MTTACVIQARTGSTRLPGKVLLDVGGKPMLAFLIERLQRLPVDQLVVATSDLPTDDPIDDLVTSLHVRVVRGSEDDVLARFGAVIESIQADHVIRLTADCPLVDPAIVEAAVDQHLRVRADYTSNTLARTYPDGLDVEVIRTAALAEAVQEADDRDEREHVTPFLYRRPRRFGLSALCSGESLGAERWTVDQPDDLERVRSIVGRLEEPVHASWRDVLAVAGRRSAPRRGSLWLAPDCWPGVAHRRAWHAMIDGDAVGRAVVEVQDPGRGRLSFQGPTTHRQEAEQLVRKALLADRQVVHLEVDRGP